MLRLNLIGPGRVGLSLARLWQASGTVQVQAVLARTPGRAASAVAHLGQGRAVDDLAAMPPAELWLLAVPDTQVGPLAAQLAAHQAAHQSALRATSHAAPQAALQAAGSGGMAAAVQAWHCSGFLPAAELAPLQGLGWAVASVHPALSFTDPDTACAQFPGTVCALEGDAPALARAQALMSAIGGRCFTLAAADKPLYHAAAVFASNFLPVLQAVATELWQGTGVPPEWGPALAQGFVQRAAANLARLPPREALTGPAARGDARVLQAQGQAVAGRDEALGQAYAALSELAGRLSRQGHCLSEPDTAPRAAP